MVVFLSQEACNLVRVVSRNSHTAQPRGSACWFSNVAGGPVSDHQTLLSHRYYFRQPSRGSGIVHCRRSGQVEGVGGFKPRPHTWVPAAFPTTRPSTQGKVVSTALGAPPPDVNVDSIGQSLTTDRDEESVLSKSYSDRHSTTMDSSTMWGRQLRHSSEREPKPQTTEHKDKDSYKSSDKDHDRNCDRERDRSKKGNFQHGSEWPHERSPWHKDYDGEHSSASKHERSCRHEGPFDDRKAKHSCGASASPSHSRKKSHTPECHSLPPPPISHSTPLAAPPKLSSDPASTRLSFNCSRSSLPPLKLGEGDAHAIPSMSVPVQAGTPSMAGPLPLHSISVPLFAVLHLKHMPSPGWGFTA